MNQADALKRIETLEAQKRQRDLQPVLESLAAQTGVSVDAILVEAERLITTYGADPVAIESGVSWETALSVDEVRAEAEHFLGAS